MKEELISIVVPCYNVENYVEKAIDSLINQTYKNICIIAIDDCSKDGTYEILKKIEKKYTSKMKVYRNDINKGAGYTRNRAIQMVDTKYIGFIDPDDFVEPNYYSELMSKFDNQTEIVITNMVLSDEKGNDISEVKKACGDNGEVNKKEILNNSMVASPCNKLFKTELIKKFLFLENTMNEDVPTVIPAILNSEKINYTDKTIYHYVQRKNSTQNSQFSNKRFDMFIAVDECLKRIEKLQEYESYKDIIICQEIIELYLYVLLELKSFKERNKYLKVFIKKQEKYELYKNKTFQKNIQGQFKKRRIYLQILLRLLKYKKAWIIAMVVSFKNILKKMYDFARRKKIKRNVIKRDLSIKDLEKEAKKQSEMKQSNVKISVIVPNYNYEKFLIQRLYSILYQTEKIYEIIILDDCSTDHSRELIDKIVNKVGKYINIKKVYNEENSGRAFIQWQKGFSLADGDYIWIAEADDYCNRYILKELLKPIKKDLNITLAYVDTAFINAEGKIFLKTIKPEIDIMKTGHWNKSYINNGLEELKNFSFLNCTVANVSSALMKKGQYDEYFSEAIKYKQVGDWIFYIRIMMEGNVAFINKSLNYYRVHGENITSKMKKLEHYEEIKRIHKYISELIELKDWQYEEYEKRYEFLRKVWNI